jgi:protein-S-isoprenylcysteine O-methyltransferase Ste14
VRREQLREGVTPMFVLARAAAWSALFIGSLLVFLPGRILSQAGVTRPPMGAPQWCGIALVVAGGALALWCIGTFVLVGKGTPAPFDPPRRLVVRGPYRFGRNPMYLGAGLALGGAGLVYRSWPLLAYAVMFLIVTHLFVIAYEEPTLRKKFGDGYADYCRRVRRWGAV